MNTPASIAMSVRLPGPLRAEVAEVAKRHHVSVNRYIEESLRKALEEERRTRLQEGYRLLSEREVPDMEWAMAAQTDIALGNED